MPTFWIALVALYICFYRLDWFPGGGRSSRGQPAAAGHRPYTVDALLAGNSGLFVQALRHLLLPALVLAASTSACSPASPALRCSR